MTPPAASRSHGWRCWSDNSRDAACCVSAEWGKVGCHPEPARAKSKGRFCHGLGQSYDRYLYAALRWRVRAPLRAAACRDALLRLRAAVRACCESAPRDAACRGSRLRTSCRVRVIRRGVGLRGCAWPLRYSRSADRRVLSCTRPFLGGGSFTPARRALETPMAMACLVERAPCLPRRMCSISSRTNSPAWVEGDLPSRLARSARSRVVFSGIRASCAFSVSRCVACGARCAYRIRRLRRLRRQRLAGAKKHVRRSGGKSSVSDRHQQAYSTRAGLA